MRRAPSRWTLGLLLLHAKNGAQRGLADGSWVPARPEGYHGLVSRFQLAWLVFTGRADALTWPEDDTP